MESKEFKSIRLRYRYTQQQFADLLGIGSGRTVANYEAGRNIPESVVKLLELMVETGKIF